jgi:hypothetical protein
MAGSLSVKQVQLGDNSDTTKNIVISVTQPSDGTFKISKGSIGAIVKDVLTVGINGEIGLPFTPMASARRTPGNLNTLSNTALTYDAVDVNVGGCFTGGNLFTCPVAGVYRVVATDLTMPSLYCILNVKKNTTVLNGSGYSGAVGASDTPQATLHKLVTCAAGDTLQVVTTGSSYGSNYCTVHFELVG